jgi:excinuclease UvrABC nuclease subunit
MSKWFKFGLFPNKCVLPNKPCVYAVYFDGDLVYVGQSSSLSNRFSGHAFRYGYAKNIVTPWQTIDDKVKIDIKAKFSERLGDWAMWEIRLIRRLKPIFNRHHINKRKEQMAEVQI